MRSIRVRRFAHAVAACLVVLTLAGCGSAPVRLTAADLTNPLLSPEYSVWLIGPIALLATPAEIDGFLALRDDAAAAAFIEAFWARRATGAPGENRLRRDFDARAEVADERFSEAGVIGRRTARGALWVIYGPPTETDYDPISQPELGPIEIWKYGPDAPVGLDGRRPQAQYRFVKNRDLTVLLQGTAPRPRRPPTP